MPQDWFSQFEVKPARRSAQPLTFERVGPVPEGEWFARNAPAAAKPAAPISLDEYMDAFAKDRGLRRGAQLNPIQRREARAEWEAQQQHPAQREQSGAAPLTFERVAPVPARMPETLAQRIRAKYPGAYDDLSDQQLEAAIRKKFPGVYDDLPMSPQAPAGSNWFAANAPQDDPFAAFVVQPVKPASPEDFMPPQPEGSALGRFASGAWEMLNPIAMVEGIGHALANPIDTLSGLASAHVEQGRKAIDMVRQGRISEALGHAGAAVLPVVGPVAANVGEKIGQGDVAGGLGQATGLVSGILAPGAIASRVKSIGVGGPFANRNPVAAEAIAAGQLAGVPIDAATATGNRAIGAVQHMADRSLIGSQVAEKAAQQQAQGLATMGEQLAAKANTQAGGAAVTAEQAGEGVRQAVHGQIGKHGRDASAAYDKLREIEADPKNTRTIEIEPKPGTSAAARGSAVPAAGRRFAKEGASFEELWQGVLGDARRNGFKGSADDLKVEFADRMRAARSLTEEMSQISGETGGAALLAEIRRLGGLRPFSRERVAGQVFKDRGDFAAVVEEFGARSGWSQRGGSSVFREKGLAVDDMIQQLQQHPHWKNVITDERDLLNALDDIARQGPEAAGLADVEHTLRGLGVERGSKWWEGTPAVKGESMQLPVDLRGVREALGPVYQSLKRESELVPLMGDKGRALVTLDRLMTGPDHAPLSTVDSALGELKSFARAEVPELRTAGQGAVAQAVKQLDDWVKMTAESAGPEALEALERGRAATTRKYESAGVFNPLEGKEAVGIYRKLTAAKDAGIGELRDIAKQAPEQLPQIGRALLDELMGQATQGGSFEHAAAIASRWEKLGGETKRLLYSDPGYIKQLDQFFHLAKITARNANPSGTAHALAAAGQGGAVLGALTGTIEPLTAVATLIGPAAVSKFLHSRAGVRLLTKGYRIPLGNKAARAAWVGQVSRLAEELGIRGSLPATADADEHDPFAEFVVSPRPATGAAGR